MRKSERERESERERRTEKETESLKPCDERVCETQCVCVWECGGGGKGERETERN